VAYREVGVVEIREVLWLRLEGIGFRAIAQLTSLDRKTVRHTTEHATELGVSRREGEEQIDDELISALIWAIQTEHVGVRGDAWQACEAERESIKNWLEDDLTPTKVHELLNRERHGLVPYRTLHRFAREELGVGKRRATIRVDDCEPGQEVQVDFGLMGMLNEPEVGQRRKVWALIFTAVSSRHQFVHLTYRQTLEDVIESFGAAWAFFGGVFHVVIPDCVARHIVVHLEHGRVRPLVERIAISITRTHNGRRRQETRPGNEHCAAHRRIAIFGYADLIEGSSSDTRARRRIGQGERFELHGSQSPHGGETAIGPHSPLKSSVARARTKIAVRCPSAR
jgi:hypothetical protein